MIEAIAILLVCQLAGETLALGMNLPLPGPVLGLIFLFIGLVIARRIGKTSTDTIMIRRSGRRVARCSSIYRSCSCRRASA